MSIHLIAIGFVGMGFGVVVGAASCLGIARRWRHDGKILRRASAQLVMVADDLYKKGRRELEQARELKAQIAALIPAGMLPAVSEERNLQLLRASRD